MKWLLMILTVIAAHAEMLSWNAASGMVYQWSTNKSDWRLTATPSVDLGSVSEGARIEASVVAVPVIRGIPMIGAASTPAVLTWVKPITTNACTFSLSTISSSFSWKGGGGSVTVSGSPRTCTWGVSGEPFWVEGATNGTAYTFSVARNNNFASRSATLIIAGQPFQITQQGK